MTAIETVQSGDWNDPETWDLARVPTIHDRATISTGHIVTADGTEEEPLVIEVGGVFMWGSCDMSHVVFRTLAGVAVSSESPLPVYYTGYTIERSDHDHDH